MKRSFLFLPLGLMLAGAAANAQTTDIPLPPPTPLYPGTTPAGGSSNGAQSVIPTKQITTKPAAEYTDAELRAMGTSIAFPYELLDTVLRRFVSTKGELYYLKAKGDNDLETFVRAVAIADVSQFPVFTTPVDPKDATKGTYQDTSAELTFWINAYNGLRIKAITDAYPLQSILTIKDFETAKNYTVAGKKYSFTELRDKIGAMDPRALFAITNGTVDGPTVPLSVFRFSRLSEQLDQAAKSYVNDPNKVGPPDRLSNKVQVSPYLKLVDPYFKKNKSARRKFEGIRQVLGTYTDNGAARNYFVTGEYNVDFTLANGKLNEQLGDANVAG